MKAIVLAGGKGKRLLPISKCINKHFFPIGSKPLIYYSLSIPMLANIREILIICNFEDKKKFINLLGFGSNLGIKIKYKIQKNAAGGILEGLKIGKKFIGKEDVLLVLGDNFIWGQGLKKLLDKVNSNNNSTIFSYHVKNPKGLGVLKKSKGHIKIIEKPKSIISKEAIIGIYFYKNKDLKFINKIKRSKRGELEITSYNNLLLRKKNINIINLGRGFTWIDCGTYENFNNANQFVSIIEGRQENLVGSIDEIAYQNNWINRKRFLNNISKYGDENIVKMLNDIKKN